MLASGGLQGDVPEATPTRVRGVRRSRLDGSGGPHVVPTTASARIWVTRKDDVRAPRTRVAATPRWRSARTRAICWQSDGTAGGRPSGTCERRPRRPARDAVRPASASWPCGRYTGCAPWGARRASRASTDGGEAHDLGRDARAHPAAWASTTRAAPRCSPGGQQSGRDAHRQRRAPRPGARRGAIVRGVAGGRATYIPRDSKATVSSARFEDGRPPAAHDRRRRRRATVGREDAARARGPARPRPCRAGFAAAAVSPDGTRLAVAARSSGGDRLVVRDVAHRGDAKPVARSRVRIVSRRVRSMPGSRHRDGGAGPHRARLGRRRTRRADRRPARARRPAAERGVQPRRPLRADDQPGRDRAASGTRSSRR